MKCHGPGASESRIIRPNLDRKNTHSVDLNNLFLRNRQKKCSKCLKSREKVFEILFMHFYKKVPPADFFFKVADFCLRQKKVFFSLNLLKRVAIFFLWKVKRRFKNADQYS